MLARWVILLLALLWSGSAYAQAASRPGTPDRDNPRIGSVRWRTFIWATPVRSKDHIALGSIRIGTTVALKSAEPVKGSTKWYALEPFGYVMADETTTFDFDAPYWKALSQAAPKDAAYPYHYGYSMGAPMYSRLPTAAEQRAAESELGPVNTFRPMGEWANSHERLLSQDPADRIKPSGPIPSFIRGNQPLVGSPWHPAKPKVKLVPAGSGVAYVRSFEAQGRVWLLTPELLLVPADRVFAYQRSTFHGVELNGEMRLPLAWVRAKVAPKYQRAKDGSFSKTAQTWANKTAVLLSDDAPVIEGGVRFRRTREGGHWLAMDAGVSLVAAEKKLRFGIRADERWVWASITRGTMVAYDGLKPVWTTLWSGGKGGLPIRGNDPRKYHTTEVGVFPLQWKDRVATMSPDKGSPTVFWFPAVPTIQYIKGPMALHVSYWHQNFGNLMSAECLNVSAADGRWLFDFTRPSLPRDWNSVRPHKLTGKSTKFRIVP